jgi:hypothetical protein
MLVPGFGAPHHRHTNPRLKFLIETGMAFANNTTHPPVYFISSLSCLWYPKQGQYCVSSCWTVHVHNTDAFLFQNIFDLRLVKFLDEPTERWVEKEVTKPESKDCSWHPNMHGAGEGLGWEKLFWKWHLTTQDTAQGNTVADKLGEWKVMQEKHLVFCPLPCLCILSAPPLPL